MSCNLRSHCDCYIKEVYSERRVRLGQRRESRGKAEGSLKRGKSLSSRRRSQVSQKEDCEWMSSLLSLDSLGSSSLVLQTALALQEREREREEKSVSENMMEKMRETGDRMWDIHILRGHV